MDPTSEQPKPTLETMKSPDEVKSVIEEFIRDEPLGTVKSRAFCDLADLAQLNSVVDVSPQGIVNDFILRKANVEETIRQRANELPGYRDSYTQAVGLKEDLEKVINQAEQERHAEGRAKWPLGADYLGDTGEKREARGKASNIMYQIKEDYVEGKLKPLGSTPGTPSGAPPSAPSF